MENKTMTISLNEKRTLSIAEACMYTGLGRNRCRDFMNQIGATVKIGKRVLFDRTVIDRYFDSLTTNK